MNFLPQGRTWSKAKFSNCLKRLTINLQCKEICVRSLTQSNRTNAMADPFVILSLWMIHSPSCDSSNLVNLKLVHHFSWHKNEQCPGVSAICPKIYWQGKKISVVSHLQKSCAKSLIPLTLIKQVKLHTHSFTTENRLNKV